MALGDWLMTAAALFVAGVVFVFAAMVKYERGKNDGYRAQIADLTDMLRDRQVGHICTPPVYGPRAADGQWRTLPLGHNWRCSCGVLYVVKSHAPRPDLGPWRIEWVTEREHRDGVRPPWDRRPRAQHPHREGSAFL